MPEWLLDDLTHPGTRIAQFSNVETALKTLEQSNVELLLLSHQHLAIDAEAVTASLLSSVDLLHAGLCFGGNAAFNMLPYVSLNWHFLNPQPTKSATSWKATSHFCGLRPRQLRALGGFDLAYVSHSARLMDIAFRLQKAGGRVRYDPSYLTTSPETFVPVTVPLVDEFIFIRRHLGINLARYALFSVSLTRGNLFRNLQAYYQSRQRIRKFVFHPTNQLEKGDTHLLRKHKKQTVTSITAIIPTLNRYDYLPQAVNSLRQQSHPPDQIVIVDQTPHDKRQAKLYDSFGDNVQVIFSNELGQSVARNTAVMAANGEWLLFFDDDSVAWDEMITHHVQLVEYSGSHVSTGVSLAPWKDTTYIPDEYRHSHLTNVLDTGNSLVNKQAILAVGGFDRAFDKGSGADNDLGTRLYQQGYEIVFNPRAIRTHYKATQGGLRTHGAWWRQKTNMWDAFPPATQVYTVQRYYPHSSRLSLYLLFFLQARHRNGLFSWGWLWLTSPFKITKALRAAQALKPQLGWLNEDSATNLIV